MKLEPGEFTFESMGSAKIGDIVEAVAPGTICVVTDLEVYRDVTNGIFKVFTYKVRPATETERLLYEVLND
jgi:hypothetical protein